MQASRKLLQHRQPMIRFLGKRKPPARVDHTPHAHPASPNHELPDTFANYRQRASQHGPLKVGANGNSSTLAHGRSGASLGPVAASKGEYFDVTELPRRFQHPGFSEAEMEAIETGGASTLA